MAAVLHATLAGAMFGLLVVFQNVLMVSASAASAQKVAGPPPSRCPRASEDVLMQKAVSMKTVAEAKDQLLHPGVAEGAAGVDSGVAGKAAAIAAETAPALRVGASDGNVGELLQRIVVELPTWRRLLYLATTVVLILLSVRLLAARQASVPGGEGTKIRSAEEAEADREVERLKQEAELLAAKAEELDARVTALRAPAAPELDDEELRRATDLAAESAEQALRRQIAFAVENVAPTVAKAQKVKRCLEDGIQSARAEAEALAMKRATSLAETAFAALEVKSSPVEAVRWLRGESSGSGDSAAGEAAAPPLTLLLAAVAAPAQLQVLATWNRLQLALAVLVLLAFSGSMAYDVGRPCGTGMIWIWSAGMAGIMGSCVLLRLAVLSSAIAAMNEAVVTTATSVPLINAGDNWVVAARQRLLASSGDFFKALLGYDRVANSASSGLLNFLNVTHIIWGAVGVVECALHVVEDSTSCDAGAVRLVAHVYVFIYMMLLSWTLPMLFLWVGGSVLNLDKVQTTVLKHAKRFDEESSIGVPIVSLLARTFLLRRITGIADHDKADLQASVDDLKKKKAELAGRLTMLSTELDWKESRFQDMAEARRKELDEELASEAEATQAEEQRRKDSARELARAALERAKEAGVDLEALSQKVRTQAAAAVASSDQKA